MTESAQVSAEQGAFTFRVEADSDADVLSRVVNQVRLVNICPTYLSMTVREDTIAVIEFELRAITAAAAERITRKLGQLTTVIRVQAHSDGS